MIKICVRESTYKNSEGDKLQVVETFNSKVKNYDYIIFK